MRPQDIEIRPAMVKDGEATLLLYQDSRNTMDALDRNFGEFGWKIEYKDVAGQIYGRLSIKDPEAGEWITKEDTGEESNISAQKGQSSDILKRCAVRFGYGRELYTAPRIKVPDDKYGNTGYRVSSIAYNDNREISQLTIVNRFGKTVYEFWQPVSQPTQVQSVEHPYVKELREFCKERMKVEPEWKEDIKKFGKTYADMLDKKGWNGRFLVDRLYDQWCEKRYVKN